MQAAYASLSVERNVEGVAEIVLVGPGKGNAMGPDFWREVPDTFARIDRDDSIRAVVVRGQGQNFSYGLDLMAMMGSLGPLFSGAHP